MPSSSSAPKDLTEENKKFFNEQAATYENRVTHTRLTQVVGEEILRSKEWSGVTWDEDSTRMLDYACGTGLISRILAPYTKQLIGMDISEGMVEQFNTNVDNQGITRKEMHAIVANLCADELDPVLSDPEYRNFDVAISTLAFHHFNNVPLAIKRISERLKPETGVLLIVDFRIHEPINGSYCYQHSDHTRGEQHHHQQDHHQQDHHQQDHHQGHSDPDSRLVGLNGGAHIVTHFGFSEDEIIRWYEEAGFVDVEVVDVGPGKGIAMVGRNPVMGETNTLQRAVFMAKGRRA